MARRRRWIRWIAAAAGLLVFVLATGLVVIQTAWFKDWLRAQAVARASSVLDGELRIARLGGDLWTGVTLDGVEILRAGRLVIAADRIRIRYDLWTLAERRWNFDDIVLERADVHVVQTPEGWNVAQLVRRREPARERATLSIGRLRLVSSRVAIEPAQARPRILTGVDADVALRVDRGRVALSIASLTAHDEATGLTLQELSGRADDTFRSFDVQLTAASPATSISGRVRGQETEEGREIAGDLDLVHVDAGRLLDDRRWATDVTGRLSARASLPAAGPSAGSADVEFTFGGTDVAALGYAATRLDAKGRVDATRVTFDARVQAYSARAIVSGEWRLPVGGHTGGFAGRGTFASVDLRRLPPRWRFPALQTTLAGRYDVRWRPAEWTARTTLDESVVEGATIGAGTEGAIASSKGVLRYGATGDLARLDLQRLAQPLHLPVLAEPRFASDLGGTFQVSGQETGETDERRLAGGATFATARLSGTEISGMTATVDWAGRRLAIEAHGPFTGLNNTTAAPLRVPIALNGQVDGVFVIHDVARPLTADNAEADGRLVLGSSTIRGVSIDAATIDARLVGGQAEIRSLDVRGRSSTVQAKGRLALSGAGDSDLHVVASSSDLRTIGELVGQPLAGALALDAQITGTASSPAARGTVSLQQPAYGNIASALTTTIAFTGEWPDRAPERLALTLDAAATFVEVKGQRIQQVSAKAMGTLSQLTLELQAQEQTRTLDLMGVMAVDKDARELRLQRLALSTEGVSWALPADGSALVRVRPGQVDFEGLTLTNGEQRIDLAGRIESSVDVRVTLERVAVADINRLLLGTRNLTGQINGSVTVTGDRQAPIVEANIGIREGAVEGVLFQSADARLRVHDRQAVLDATLVQSPGVSLAATGTIPVGRSGESDAAMDVRIKGGPMSLGLAQAFTAEITRVTGAATLDLRVTGTPEAPDVRGTMSVAGGGFVVTATGAEYRDLEARLEFEGPTLAVRHLQLVDPDGDRLTASGALGVMGPRGDRQVDVQVRAAKVSVLRNHFGTADIDADLRVQGTLGAPRIEGTLALDEGRLEVAEILERTTRSAYSTTPQAPLTSGAAEAPAPGLFDRTSLALRLTLPDNLALRGRQLRVANGNFGIGDMNILVGGEFDLVKPAGGRLDLQGTADVVRGTYTFQGRRFDVVPGSDVRFRGGAIGDPALNLTATREVAGITAQVRLQGTARTPRVTLSSRPPLEEGDVLSLIVFNQPMSALSASDQSNLADRAASIAAGALTTPLADSIARVLNLDVVEIQAPTSDDGTGSVAFGSRIGSRVFVGLRQHFGREDASVLSLEYRVTEVLRFVSSVAQGALQAHATRRTDQSGVDLIFVIRY